MAFTAGQTLRADDLNDAVGGDAQYEYDSLAGTVTSLTSQEFIEMLDSDSKSCGVGFVAPPSGKVIIRWGMNAKSGVSGSTVLVGTAVRTGATVGGGDLQDDVVDDDCLEFSQTATVPGCRERPVDSLTDGDSYNVRIWWRNSGSTTSVGNKPWISVTPVLS